MPEEKSELYCAEHNQAIARMDTTLINAKWGLSIAGSVFGFILMIMGWVANDNLSGIRGDLKEAKGMLQNIQRETDGLKIRITYIEKWQTEMENGIHKR